jgi:hypothetical protein
MRLDQSSVAPKGAGQLRYSLAHRIAGFPAAGQLVVKERVNAIGLAPAGAGLGFVLSLAPVAFADHRPAHAEATVIGEMRSMMAAPEKRRPTVACVKHGYSFTAVTGSSGSFAYVAVPTEPGSGIRGFCSDSSGVLCFTAKRQSASGRILRPLRPRDVQYTRLRGLMLVVGFEPTLGQF